MPKWQSGSVRTGRNTYLTLVFAQSTWWMQSLALYVRAPRLVLGVPLELEGRRVVLRPLESGKRALSIWHVGDRRIYRGKACQRLKVSASPTHCGGPSRAH